MARGDLARNKKSSARQNDAIEPLESEPWPLKPYQTKLP
jgi:hypothetical protein